MNAPVCPICSNTGRYKHWEKKPQGHNYFPVPGRPCPVCPTGRALIPVVSKEEPKKTKVRPKVKQQQSRERRPRRRRS